MDKAKKVHLYSDYCVRGTKALLIAISCLSIPILKSNWTVYGVTSIIMVVMIASIAWRGLGDKLITIGNKTYSLLYVDVIVGNIIGFYVLIILKF